MKHGERYRGKHWGYDHLIDMPEEEFNEHYQRIICQFPYGANYTLIAKEFNSSIDLVSKSMNRIYKKIRKSLENKGIHKNDLFHEI